MGKNRYQRAVEILEDYKGKKLGLMKLRSLIVQNIGSDERTINEVLKTCLETKLIKDVGAGHFEVL